MKNKNLTRKDKERLFRRTAIMDAAVGFFAKKGFRDTTLDEIAIAAEFGKGTIYNYFKGKEDIYSAIIDEVSINLYDIIQKADSESVTARDFLILYSKLLLYYCFNNREAFIIFVREVAHFTTDIFIHDRKLITKRHDEVKNLLIRKISEGIKSKEFKKYNPENLANLYEHLIFPYVLFLINFSDDTTDQENEIEFILSVFFNGIINKTKPVKR